MNILILGGTGLISTAITRQLAARGDAVTVYNRGKTKVAIPDVQRITGDRKDTKTFEAQMHAAPMFDAVIDMIAFTPADVESAIRAFGGRTEQYIFCSTVDVYTKPAVTYPVVESAERKPSKSFMYAYQKAQCERILEQAHADGLFQYTSIRPAWTYGEQGSLLHALGWGSWFLDRVRKGLPLIVPGDGTSFWAAAHRDDVARAFVGALANPKAYGTAYHATGEELFTWNAYHRIIAQVMAAPEPELVAIPSDVLVKYAPDQAAWCEMNFHYNNIFDNSAAKQDLGYAYTIPFAEGAKRVIEATLTRDGIEDAAKYPFYDRIIEKWRETLAAIVSVE